MLAQPTQYFIKGMIIPLEGSGTARAPISFQWNPKTIKEDKGVQWARLKPIGREQPILQYSIGQARVISFDIDVSEPGGTGTAAKAYINRFLDLTKPTIGGNVKRPPKLKLVMGQNISMVCVLTAVSNIHGPQFHPITLGPQQSSVRLTFAEFK